MLYTWNLHNIVNQLYLNKKKKKRKNGIYIHLFTV